MTNPKKQFFDLTKEDETRNAAEELRSIRKTLQSIEDLLVGIALRPAKAAVILAALVSMSSSASAATGRTPYGELTTVERESVMTDIAERLGVPPLKLPEVVIDANSKTKGFARGGKIYLRDEGVAFHIFFHEAVHVYQRAYKIKPPEYALGCELPFEAQAWRESFEWCSENNMDCPLHADDWKIKAKCGGRK